MIAINSMLFASLRINDKIEHMSINILDLHAFKLVLEIEIPAYIYFRLHLVYFTWYRYSVYKYRYSSLYDVQLSYVWRDNAHLFYLEIREITHRENDVLSIVNI
jgi:hypothetical protein